MKKNKQFKYRLCIVILSVAILIPIIANARYFEKIENIKGKATIAEPIFKVEKLQETIVDTINKESSAKEYVFCIKNYVLENGNTTKRISQVNIAYTIEIINEKKNFPVKCELYEVGKNENLLNSQGKTKDIVISKDTEYLKTYKLVVSWENKEGTLEETDNIKIIVNASQVK